MSCPQDVCLDSVKCLITGPAVLSVTPLTRGSTVIEWDLTKIPNVETYVGPLEIAIDYSRSGTAAGPWVELMEYTSDSTSFTVTDQIPRGSDLSTYYQLRMRDAAGDVWVSRAYHAFETIPKSFGRTYREIIRRWLERAQLGELRSGYLLRRSRWGALCTTCTDRDGRQKIRSQCPDCYDAGFQQGFTQYLPCFYMQGTPSQMSEEFRFEQGWFQQGPVTRFLWLAIPQVYPGDVWVDRVTDERWLLGSPLTVTTRIGAYDLIASSPAARLDSTHVIYQFPVERGP